MRYLGACAKNMGGNVLDERLNRGKTGINSREVRFCKARIRERHIIIFPRYQRIGRRYRARTKWANFVIGISHP